MLADKEYFLKVKAQAKIKFDLLGNKCKPIK